MRNVVLTAAVSFLTFTACSRSWANPPSQSRFATSGACSPEFIDGFKKVAVEINTVSVYMKAKQVPPNLVRAIKTCDRFERGFPDSTCDVGTQSVSTTDVSTACAAVRKIADAAGVKIPADVPPPTASELRDETPVAILANAGIVATIKNAKVIESFIATPKLKYFIAGKVVDFKSSLLSKADVRCTITLAPTEVVQPVQQGSHLRSNAIDETVVSDYFSTDISFAGAGWAIACAKHVWHAKADGAITYGELKRALGSFVEFSYDP